MHITNAKDMLKALKRGQFRGVILYEGAYSNTSAQLSVDKCWIACSPAVMPPDHKLADGRLVLSRGVYYV